MTAKMKSDFVTIYQLQEIGALDFLKQYDPKNEPKAEPGHDISERQHSILMGSATSLISHILDATGTKEDLQNAILYAYAILDARKHRYDVGGLMQKYGYIELYSKYMPDTEIKKRHLRWSEKMMSRKETE